MILQTKIIGILLVVLALAHSLFPKYFKWKEELQSMQLINRQMMKIHTLFIALMVLLMGLLCLTSSYELTQTYFGKKISFGLGLFWFLRLMVQFFGYSPQLWKGKKMETTIHVFLSIFWLYLSVVFFWIAFR
ncbi:hypothetical protein [Riemerella columbina]|uniref:hypothetical protein n=1 Tax=Riemerella columbina TaxID=103810 RepID=UPI00035C8396|nr:hypothetical protein [Riemerella columbina]